MKKHRIILSLLGLLLAASLMACRSDATPSAGRFNDKLWKNAVSENSIRDYVKTNMNEYTIAYTMEGLEKAAGDDSLSLNQQFRVTVLLCELEYQQYMKEIGEYVSVHRRVETKLNGMFHISDNAAEIAKGAEVFAAEYPVSAYYASDFLAKVETAGDEFWDSIELASYPYNYFINLFAAADSISGEILAKLITECPAASSDMETQIIAAIDSYLEVKPQRLIDNGEQLAQTDYFKNKGYSNLSAEVWGESLQAVTFDDADQGLGYLQFMKETMLPYVEKNFSDDYEDLIINSIMMDDTYYTTGLNITIADDLDLKDDSIEVETVVLEGKKVIAFYYNQDNTTFLDAPEPLRIIGDFMMSLPEDQFAATLAEADYYLVLTPNYMLGDFYQVNTSKDIQIQKVYSFTSIDLYEAESGMRIRHIGTVKEDPREGFHFVTYDELAPLEYPVMFSVGRLLFIYQNINETEVFQHMLTVYEPNQGTLGVGDSAKIENWEVILNSYEVKVSFQDGMKIYTANDGYKTLHCSFTINNHGTKDLKLFPMLSYVGEDLFVKAIGSDGKTYKPATKFLSSQFFQEKTFEPGESMTGYMLFELPDSAIDGEQPISIEFSLDPQKAVFALD